MAIEGNLEVFQLPEILQMISGQRKTGILTVQGEADIVAVSFKEGQVVAADALNQTVEEGLGQVLASQGLVNPKDFSAVIAEHEASGKRLLDVLLERGHLNRGQLLEALRLQTYRLLLQLLRWEQGDFKFYGGDEVAFEEGFYAISVEELLIRSLSDLGDDGQGGSPPDLSAVYERAPGGPPIRFIGLDGPAPDSSGVWLGPEDKRLVEALESGATGSAVASSTGLGEYRVLFTLYRLLRAGALRAKSGGAARPASAAKAPAAAPVAAKPAPGPAPRTGAVPAQPAHPTGAHPTRPSTAPGFRTGSHAAAAVAEAPPLPDTDLPEIAPAPAPPTTKGRKVMVVPPKPATPGPLALWTPRVMALAVGALVAAAPWFAPRHLLLPFPWEDGARAAVERNQRAALFQAIDRAARTYFLLEGHYPDDLTELVNLDMLPPFALADPAGRRLAYSADDLSYEVQPLVNGAPVAELAAREAITGDFLLDPDFLDLPDKPEKSPLVLLD